jgi:GNAT superfamily N-acetyltransferase
VTSRSGTTSGAVDIVVRRATYGDLDAVVALRLELLREYPDHPVYGNLRPDADVRARPLFAAQLESPAEAMFLALERGVAVGVLRCVESAASPLLLPERYCYVSSAYVRPALRRQGVLTELFGHAVAWARERGLTQMRLHNVGTREDSASTWQALGFEPIEQVRFLKLPAL